MFSPPQSQKWLVVHIATPDSSALKFAQVRFQLAIHYPEAETVHLVRMTQISMHSNLLKRLLNPEVASQSSACLVIELIVLCVHPGDIKYLDATLPVRMAHIQTQLRIDGEHSECI